MFGNIPLFKPTGGGGGGGAGGVSLRWYEPDSLGPVKALASSGLEYYAFNNTEEQSIYAMLKVPTSYVAGTQIFLKSGLFYSSVNTGNVKFLASTYIFDANIDATSLPTGYNSTNAQQAVNGTANRLSVLSDIDLTNATGQINSVAVQPGDLLFIVLVRDTSAETSGAAADVNLLIDSFEPSFSA